MCPSAQTVGRCLYHNTIVQLCFLILASAATWIVLATCVYAIVESVPFGLCVAWVMVGALELAALITWLWACHRGYHHELDYLRFENPSVTQEVVHNPRHKEGTCVWLAVCGLLAYMIVVPLFAHMLDHDDNHQWAAAFLNAKNLAIASLLFGPVVGLVAGSGLLCLVRMGLAMACYCRDECQKSAASAGGHAQLADTDHHEMRADIHVVIVEPESAVPTNAPIVVAQVNI